MLVSELPHINDTEGSEEKRGVSNRCLIFDNTDGSIRITEYGEQERVSGEDAVGAMGTSI